VRNIALTQASENWRGVGMLAAAAFVIVTSEFLPIGLLDSIAASLGVSAGVAGLMVTMPGLLAACSGPVLMAMVGRRDRRTLLVAMCLLLLGADLLAALAPGLATMLVARVMLGVVVGGFWTFAPGACGNLVAADGQAKALSWILAGISAATVAGVPAGVYVGSQFGWRGAFAILATLALVLGGLLWAMLPAMPVAKPADHTAPAHGNAGLLGPLRDRRSLVVLLVTLFAVAGHFAAYTYLAPLLQDRFGLAPSDVTTMLLLYGIAGLASTLVAPRLINGNLRLTLLGLLGTAALVLFLSQRGGGMLLASLCALAWGSAFGMMPGCLNAWMQQAQPHATDAGQAWFVGFFQSAIALGAWGGGLLLDHLGVGSAAILGMTLELLAAGVVFVAYRK
jgi:predicted MFS family arabinose efflux permease